MGDSAGLKGYQGYFLALTLIVMIVIILMAKDLTTAVLLISLITSFLIISAQLTLIGDRAQKTTARAVGLGGRPLEAAGVSMTNAGIAGIAASYGPDLFTPAGASSDGGLVLESYSPKPRWHGRDPPYLAEPPLRAAALGGDGYPGAIRSSPGAGDAAAEMIGHSDRLAGASEGAPSGNPFDLDRYGQDAAGFDDDEANAHFDGDENVTLQARARNDPTRVWAGAYRLKAHFDPYVREELEEEEDSYWWGRHEL